MADLPLLPGVKAGATLSSCGTYRYALTRDWYPKVGTGHVAWIMLNPSVASAEVDDRTIRKCQKFARTWGYDGITVLNLFALRSTDPKALYGHPDPVGEANDTVIETFAAGAGTGLVVAAWGNHGAYRNRSVIVADVVTKAGVDLHHLELTGKRQPWHPLYRPDDMKPELWMVGRTEAA